MAKLATFEKDLGQAARASEKMAQRVERAMGVAASAVKMVAGPALAAVFVAGTKATADYQDQLGKLAQRSGVAVEALSGLNYAAGLADVSQEDLSKGLKKLAVELDAGGAKLKAMGITATTADGAFLQIADRFAKMPDGVRKTAEAADLFGERFGPQLITMLNMGADGLKAATDEAQRFGLIVSKEAAVAAEQFNDNLTRLAKLAEGAKISLTSDLVKGLGEATGAFLKASAEGSKLAGIIAFIQTLTTGTDRHKNNAQLSELTDKLLTAENALSAARTSGMHPSGIAAREKYVQQLKDELRTTMSYRQLLDEEDAQNAPKPKTGADGPRGGSGGGKKGKTGAELLLDIQMDRWAKEGDALSRRLAAEERDRLSLEEQNEAISKRAAERLQADIERWSQEGDALSRRIASQESATAAVADLNEELDRLSGRAADDRKRALEQRLQEQLSAGVGYTPEQLERIKQALSGAKDSASDFGNSFSVALDAVIVRGEKLSDVIKSLGLNIANIALHKAVINPLGNEAGKWLTGIFGGLFGGFRADGGPVSAGTTYLVGERGPELFTPSRSGKIIPNGAGGNTTVINNFTVGDVASMAQVQKAIAASQRATAGSLMRSRQYGGAFA